MSGNGDHFDTGEADAWHNLAQDTSSNVDDWANSAGSGDNSGNDDMDRFDAIDDGNGHANTCAFICHNCGAEGHKASECDEPKKMTGECYNCGQVGHNKADCQNARVQRPFTGTCRICGIEGHLAAECPDRKPIKCRVCEGDHKTEACIAIRDDFFPHNLPEMTAEVAWEGIIKADKERDYDDFQEAFWCYTKAQLKAGDPIDLADMEQGFREQDMNTYLIAKKIDLHPTLTIVNMKGEPNQEFCLLFRESPNPQVIYDENGWPESPEENMERLKKCGVEVDRKVLLCRRCKAIGHVMKHCKQEREEVSNRPVVRCFNCNEEGHRSRDCKQPRNDRRRTCRNCNQPGHLASECTEPRSAANVECKICSEMGHFARDCPQKEDRGPMTCRKCGEEGHMARECPNAEQRGPMACHNCGQEGHMSRDCVEPKDPSRMKCRNCDEMGHNSRECPKPRDYSRVQCRNCGEMGHTVVRCSKEKAEPSGDGGWSGSGDKNDQGASGGQLWR